MSVFEMVAIIVVASCVASVVQSYLKTKRQQAAASSPEQDQKIRKLEQRVAALEAAVSDPDHQLKDRFRELEDA